MQIHNWKAKQSILCFNRFGAGRNNDPGLRNAEGKSRDWPFTAGAQQFSRGEFPVRVLL